MLARSKTCTQTFKYPLKKGEKIKIILQMKEMNSSRCMSCTSKAKNQKNVGQLSKGTSKKIVRQQSFSKQYERLSEKIKKSFSKKSEEIVGQFEAKIDKIVKEYNDRLEKIERNYQILEKKITSIERQAQLKQFCDFPENWARRRLLALDSQPNRALQRIVPS